MNKKELTKAIQEHINKTYNVSCLQKCISISTDKLYADVYVAGDTPDKDVVYRVVISTSEDDDNEVYFVSQVFDEELQQRISHIEDVEEKVENKVKKESVEIDKKEESVEIDKNVVFYDDVKAVNSAKKDINSSSINMALALGNIMRLETYKDSLHINRTFVEFCEETFDMGKSSAYKYASIGMRFGKPDASGHLKIDDKYKDFNVSALGKLAGLTDQTINELGITSQTSCRDIDKLLKGIDGIEDKKENMSGAVGLGDNEEEAEEDTTTESMNLTAYFSTPIVAFEQLLKNKDLIEQLMSKHKSTLVCFYDNNKLSDN